MRTLPRILAVDDDLSWLQQVPFILEGQANVDLAQSIGEAFKAIENDYYDLVLLDLNFEGDNRTGIDVFHQIATLDNGVDVIVISAETRPERIVEICNAGISRFIAKPALPSRIREEVAQVLTIRESKLRARRSANRSPENPMSRLVGNSPQVLALRKEIERAVSGGFKDILLLGETGTGKEVVAKIIAELSDPAARLLPINCGAILDTLAESELFGHVKGSFTGAIKDRASIFELAAGGFVFLDEVGEMSSTHQTRLLRVLQERKIVRVGDSRERLCNFRSISATHANLSEWVEVGRFREDLYYRIAKYVIRIPALRDRPSDIGVLVSHILQGISGAANKSLSPQALQTLERYSWPGNIRQLEAVVEALAHRTKGDIVQEAEVLQVIPMTQIRQSIKPRPFLGKVGADFAMAERERYEEAVQVCSGNRARAAEKLGVSRATFYRRAKDLGIV